MMLFEVVVICRDLNDNENMMRHCIDLTRIRKNFVKQSAWGRDKESVLYERSRCISLVDNPLDNAWTILRYFINSGWEILQFLLRFAAIISYQVQNTWGGPQANCRATNLMLHTRAFWP